MSNEVNHALRGGAAAATQESGQATPALSFDGVVPLESVLCTDELDRRPSRPPDYKQENRALVALSQALADAPRTILQTLAETILDTFHVGSAGVSLLTKADGGEHFHWPAIAGMWKPHIGGGTPRHFGPCGDVLDRNIPLLFRHFERRYTYFLRVAPPVEECLLVPFYVEGKAVGTIWAITHDDRRKFDNEDLRQLASLGRFASSAYQAVEALDTQQEHGVLRALLAAIVDSSDDAIVGMTLNGFITTWNRAAESMFGYTAAEAVGQHITLIIPAERRAEEDEVLARLQRGEKMDHFETERQTKDGRRVTISLTVSPIRNAAGQIIGASKVARDITGRKGLEAALRESEIRYRRLFQNAKDGILILDAETGKIIDANAFMCGLLGQELVEILGKELYEIGMFEDEAANKAAFEELQQNGYIRYDHLPVMKPNGVKTQVEFVSNVYREGHRLVAQCNVRDISLRAKMEQQVKQQAAAMADQHRRKDEFLAMLSHELRNPLAPIRSATHLLRLQEGAGENPIQQQAREVIERQVMQLTRLVSDLLEVSRVATGRIRLNLEKIDLRPIVQDTLETVGPLIESRRQVTALTLPAQPVWVLADASRLEEVVVNLLNNAAKYTDEGGRIEVSLEHRKDHAVLRISDSGIGIAPELLPCIFDLFTQADRSLDRSQGGLGIGLNLVQRLVELHGGTVEAHSPGLGRGSEFVVRLATVPAPGIEAAVTPARGEERAAPGLRVLLVDDNVDSCNMLATLLEHSGHRVQAVHTGPTGLQAALAWRPDVVLLDIGLPEIDGYEVARRLRHDPVMKSTKLVALTGYGAASDLRLAREAGFDAHILKPVHLVELEKLLAAWVEPLVQAGMTRGPLGQFGD
ncbi:MAG TPA: PAS domain S-box protein [Thermoanaerobaculia bacterium]|nr:PAS domain S-box protein [Thermoanaerobaculia bacterium]